jgi:hypothetical protein
VDRVDCEPDEVVGEDGRCYGGRRWRGVSGAVGTQVPFAVQEEKGAEAEDKPEEECS